MNLAYEAATADLDDVNMIDPFHLQAYGETTVNYNRDVEVFPVLAAMFEKITGSCPYKSPTDMGVNMAGKCIYDDQAVQEAARQEIVRRYYDARCELRQGKGSEQTVYKLELLMQQAGITPEIRKVAAAANQVAEQTGEPAMAIELPDGSMITGKTSELMGCSAAALLNALKALSDLGGHGVHLIAQSAIEPIQTVKVKYLGSNNPRLHSDEVLIALAVFLKTTGRTGWTLYIPMCLMLIVTFTALVQKMIALVTNFAAGTATLLVDGLQLVVAVLLMVLGVMVAFSCLKKLFTAKKAA